MPKKQDRYDFLLSSLKINTSECIEWPYTLDSHGYGQIRYLGERGAHRVVYKMAHGEIAENMCIMHSCDNPKCINVSHLSQGTFKDNHDDMYAKNRCAFQKGGIHYQDFRGELHGNAKLTEEIVRKIRISKAKGGFSAREIAKIIGIGRQTVNDVITFKSWTHVV